MENILFDAIGVKQEETTIGTQDSWLALSALMQNPKLIKKYNITPEIFTHEFHRDLFQKFYNVIDRFIIKDSEGLQMATIFAEKLTTDEINFVKVIEKVEIKDPTKLIEKLLNVQPKDEFDVMDFDTLEEDRKRLQTLLDAEEEFAFYPYKVAPQTVNTLVAPTNVGKSTLTAAMANVLANSGKVAILSTEETKSDITNTRLLMTDLEVLKQQKFLHESNLTEEFIKNLFINLQRHNYNYLIIDYVNPHNIDLDADLAQKIDTFYQWLLNGAQEHNICVFAFIQSNAKAYNEKIDVVDELTTKPNRVATFTDGGIRAIVKSYSVVYLHLDQDKNRSMIACKGRGRDAGLINGSLQGYDVNLQSLEINMSMNVKLFGGTNNGKTNDSNFKGV